METSFINQTKSSESKSSESKSMSSLSTKPTAAKGLTEDEVEELRQAFDLFDTDGSGTIDPKV